MTRPEWQGRSLADLIVDPDVDHAAVLAEYEPPEDVLVFLGSVNVRLLGADRLYLAGRGVIPRAAFTASLADLQPLDLRSLSTWLRRVAARLPTVSPTVAETWLRTADLVDEVLAERLEEWSR